MRDYVSIPALALAAAVSPETAVVAFTVPVGISFNTLSADNGLDVDAVVMVGSAKPFYIRSGQAKVLDSKSDSRHLWPASEAIQIKLYAPGGAAPQNGDFVFDCML